MQKHNKLEIIGLVIIALVLIGLTINTIRLNHKLETSEAQRLLLQQVTEQGDMKLGRAYSTLTDTTDKIKQLDKQIQQDIKERDAHVVAYSELEARYNAKGSGRLSSPVVTKTMYVYEDGKPVEIKTLPFTFKDFRLEAGGDAVKKTFDYKLTQRFEIKIAETKRSNGTYNDYAELYELDPSGKQIGKLELTKFNVTRTDPVEKPHFRFFDWHLDIGVGYLVGKDLSSSPYGDLGISMMSFGTPADLRWRFVRGAVGVNRFGVQLGLAPALYNIAQPLPLINNVWVSPGMGYNIDNKTYFIGLGISAML